MLPNNDKSRKANASTWTIAIIAVYLLTGYFLGDMVSTHIGLLLTCAGAVTGFAVANRVKDSSTNYRIIALVIPIVLLGIVLSYKKTSSRKLDKDFLSGTWSAQGNGKIFTMQIQDSIALLSVEPGLKNVKYNFSIKKDSVILSADGVNPLSWHVGKIDNRVVIDAGGGIIFESK